MRQNWFLSARPARGREFSHVNDAAMVDGVSIRAARAGPRRFVQRCSLTKRSFYPRGPRGAATSLAIPAIGAALFLSARPARGRDTTRTGQSRRRRFVSIRAARAGPRPSSPTALSSLLAFLSARPARGRDHALISACDSLRGFLSARPARGRDMAASTNASPRPSFYPRGPRGAATPVEPPIDEDDDVSIRAARAGPRPVVRHAMVASLRVSIRAARAGPRLILSHVVLLRGVVSIRAARAGPRRVCSGRRTSAARFLSARPARGRDKYTPVAPAVPAPVSIRAARAGPRRAAFGLKNGRKRFYPRGPRGAATTFDYFDISHL